MDTREWADLSGDLLNLILPKVFGIDRFNFKLVCKSWNSAAMDSTYLHYPCLMFYQICCSNYGWLLMSRADFSLFFFNPSNRQTIELPETLYNQYAKIYFFNPPTSPDCIIVGIDIPLIQTTDKELQLQISLLRHRELKWETHLYIKELEQEFSVSISPPVLHSGQLHFLSNRGDIATFDINHSRGGGGHEIATFDINEGEPKMASCSCGQLHFVSETCDLDQSITTFDINEDEPARIMTLWKVNTKCLSSPFRRSRIKQQFLFKIKGEEALFAIFIMHDDKKVNVFKLMESEMKWILVHDLGDKMVYISQTSSFGDTAPLKSMANKIYFPIFSGEDILFYCLTTQKYYFSDNSYCSDKCYGLKRLDFATWIILEPTPELPEELLKWYDFDNPEEFESALRRTVMNLEQKYGLKWCSEVNYEDLCRAIDLEMSLDV